MEGWFLFTYSAKKEKQKRGERERVFPLQQSSIASESKDSEHQSWPWARKREDRRGGKLELTDSGPYWESWVRKKKKDMDWLKKMERKEKVKAKENLFTSEKGTRTWQNVIKVAVYRGSHHLTARADVYIA